MCIFCKIIEKEIPSKVVYEDNAVLAILDISQANLGHTLVMPKKHYDNLLSIADNDYLKVMDVAKKIAKKIDQSLKPDGINIINNCNEAAGQTVMHFHVHVLPRFKGDEIELKFKDNSGKFNLDEVLKKVKLWKQFPMLRQPLKKSI